MEIMSIINKLKKHYKINSLLIIPILTRRVLNKIYNFIFLKRYHIYADYSSFIYGVEYMHIGMLSVGRNCRIEMITEYKEKKLSPKLLVGNDVVINDFVHIGCSNYIEIGDNCLFASRIYISDHNHGSYKGDYVSCMDMRVVDRNIDTDKTVIIGKNVWLGEGVCVLPGSTIGDNSIIGANAVVVGEIPANCIAVGVPAKVIKFLG